MLEENYYLNEIKCFLRNFILLWILLLGTPSFPICFDLPINVVKLLLFGQFLQLFFFFISHFAVAFSALLACDIVPPRTGLLLCMLLVRIKSSTYSAIFLIEIGGVERQIFILGIGLDIDPTADRLVREINLALSYLIQFLLLVQEHVGNC